VWKGQDGRWVWGGRGGGSGGREGRVGGLEGPLCEILKKRHWCLEYKQNAENVLLNFTETKVTE